MMGAPPSSPDFLSEAPSSNTILLEVRISMYRFGGAQTFSHNNKYSLTLVGSLSKIGTIDHFVDEEIEAQKGQ